MDGFWRSFATVVILLIVIFAAYYVTKIVAGKAMPGRRGSRYIKLIDSFYLSKDKMILLITAGETAYLIGVSNQTFAVLDSFDASQVPAPELEMSSGILPGLTKRLERLDLGQWSRAKNSQGGFGEYLKEMIRKKEPEESASQDQSDSDGTP